MYKMVIRTDDVGYSLAHNMGTFETYDHGWSSHAEVMLDCPGAVDALQRLKDMPWVSIGWHTHFWNAPILGVEAVPSLVIPETGRFRHDLRDAQDVSYEEALAEFRAELNLCMDILGKAPDVGGIPESMANSPFSRAMAQVTKEYGMAYGYGHRMELQEDGSFKNGPVDPRFKDSNLYIIDQRGIVAPDILSKKTFEALEDYDAVRFLLEDRMKLHELPDGATIIHGFHPAYVDYFVAREGDYGPNMRYYTLSRVYDVEGLTSKRLHDWIKDNNIMLCNLRDAIYGTQEFQNHLRHIGSDLCMI
ncbi:MAG: ChbG/HpnK family deacetylase [Lachnospiraceae bacterium]|nr:ChbG/HpnK family deacetylase [Lachnospiraceae bacterium]